MTHWDNCKLEFRALVHPAQCISSLVDLNLCPFLVVNCNCGFKAFPESVSLSSQLLNLRVVLGPPAWSEVRMVLGTHTVQHAIGTFCSPEQHMDKGTSTCKQPLGAAPRPRTRFRKPYHLAFHEFLDCTDKLGSTWRLGAGGADQQPRRGLGKELRKRKGGGECLVLVSHWTDSASPCKLNLFSKVIPDKKTTSLSLFAFI